MLHAPGSRIEMVHWLMRPLRDLRPVSPCRGGTPGPSSGSMASQGGKLNSKEGGM